MSGYIGTQPVPQATQTRQTFTATASQTSFATGGYQAGYLDVFLNGVKLVDGTDYTATNGSDVVLTTGAASGDTLEVVAYTAFEVLNQNFTGGVTVDNDAATVLTVDRATSDGTIIDVQKNGTSVGSIGTDGSYVSIGNGAAALAFQGANNRILPWSQTANDVTDASLDMGNGNYRFKDLYLSGGVYLGGTGSANKLDDYEEGTWTPTFSGAAISVTNTSGKYTKIGNKVFFSWYSGASNISSASGNAVIAGLPFTVLGDASYYLPFYTAHNTFFGGSTSAGVEGYPSVGTTQLRFTIRGTVVDPSFVNSGTAYIMIAGFYTAA